MECQTSSEVNLQDSKRNLGNFETDLRQPLGSLGNDISDSSDPEFAECIRTKNLRNDKSDESQIFANHLGNSNSSDQSDEPTRNPTESLG